MRARPLVARRTVLAGFVALALSSCSASSASSDAPTASGEREDLAAWADSLLATAYPAGEPGAAVLVRWKGETVLRKGYGLASLELGVPATPEHVFGIGSVTKQITAAAIMKLVDAGKLSLSDPVTKHLPDFPTGGATITIEQLLTHASGIPSYTSAPAWKSRWREDVSLEALIGLFRGKPLDFPPGERWSYSNSGYVLLGAIIEKVSGRSYEEQVEKEIFAPLGMAHSRYGHVHELVLGRAQGHVRDESGHRPAPYLSPTQTHAAGAVLSTVDDIATWIDALETDQVMTPASRARMLQTAVTADGVPTRYGFGMGVRSLAGRTVHEHGGDTAGYSSAMLTVPSEKLQVVVLSNDMSSDPHPTRLAWRIAARALGEPEEKRRNLQVAESLLDEYVGVYRIVEAPDQRRVVTRSGSELRLQRSLGPVNVLRPVGMDAFASADGGARFVFIRESSGRVAAIEVDQGIGPISLSPRTDEPLPPGSVSVEPAVLDAIAGTYELAPGRELALSHRGGRLFVKPSDRDEEELVAESPTIFVRNGDEMRLEFVRATEGVGPFTGVVLRQGGRELRGRRKP